jgi:hypothetical protein
VNPARHKQPTARVVPLDDVQPCANCSGRSIVMLKQEARAGRGGHWWLCSKCWRIAAQGDDFGS